MAYLWMLVGCFSFAWMGQFAGLLHSRCDWRVVALARGGLAFIFALSLARMSGAKLVLWRPPALWLRGLAGSLSLLCTFYAYSSLRPSEVLALANTFPIWVAILSWPVLQQKPNLSVWLASFCGVCGVVVMQIDKVEFPPGSQLAVILALVAAFTSAVAMLGLNRLQGVHPWAVVAHFSGVATAFVLAGWMVGGVPPLDTLRDPITLGLLFGVGATATFGQLCLTRAFTSGHPARVSIIGLTQIIFAMVLDLMFGGEWFSYVALAGIVLVMAPTAWVMAERAVQPAISLQTHHEPNVPLQETTTGQ